MGRWRITLVGHGIRLTGAVDSEDQLTQLSQAVDRLDWIVAASPVRADPETNGLLAVVAEDLARWPEGHPCRQCGRLQRQHPHAGCMAWS